jgi:hypothetical protein
MPNVSHVEIFPLLAACISFAMAGVTTIVTGIDPTARKSMRPRMMLFLLFMDSFCAIFAIALHLHAIHLDIVFYDLLKFNSSLRAILFVLYFVQNMSFVWTALVVVHVVIVTRLELTADSTQELTLEKGYYCILLMIAAVLLPFYHTAFWGPAGIFRDPESSSVGRIQSPLIIMVYAIIFGCAAAIKTNATENNQIRKLKNQVLRFAMALVIVTFGYTVANVNDAFKGSYVIKSSPTLGKVSKLFETPSRKPSPHVTYSCS